MPAFGIPIFGVQINEKALQRIGWNKSIREKNLFVISVQMSASEAVVGSCFEKSYGPIATTAEGTSPHQNRHTVAASLSHG